jgi:hypothetical protein
MSANAPLVPAEAGTQDGGLSKRPLDSRLRGNERKWSDATWKLKR